MSGKLTIQLLSQTVLMLIVAAVATFGPRFLRSNYDYEKQKLFLEEVENGQREMSKERAVELLRLSMRAIDSERDVAKNALGLIQYLGYGLFGFAALQIWGILKVRSETRRLVGKSND